MRPRVAIVGPVYPYRAGIAYCTTRLAQELEATCCRAEIISFKRQYPRRFYPGGEDVDETLRDRTPLHARFELDILNPWSWIAAGWRLRRMGLQSVILVWWIWVWAVPYLVLMFFLPRGTRLLLQCHNIQDKEPAWWKSLLTNRVLRRASTLVVHSEEELSAAVRRSRGRHVVKARLPVHELGRPAPSRREARARLGLPGEGNVALFFGHVRPFKGLDIALEAWSRLRSEVLLVVAGEAWWGSEEQYRRQASALGLSSVRFDFRYIPDDEIALYFAATDVVLAPYRKEAQSGVALTAFHFGRPVIASRVGGLPEIIRDGVNGALVPPEDPAALAAAVDRFFQSADRQAMEKGARDGAGQNSWEDYGKLFSRLVQIG